MVSVTVGFMEELRQVYQFFEKIAVTLISGASRPRRPSNKQTCLLNLGTFTKIFLDLIWPEFELDFEV